MRYTGQLPRHIGALGVNILVVCIAELRCKEVINKKDGNRLGYVGDVRIDTKCGQVVALIVYCSGRWFGLFGREEDIVVPWKDVEVIGEDTILIQFEHEPRPPKPGPPRGRRNNLFGGFFK